MSEWLGPRRGSDRFGPALPDWVEPRLAQANHHDLRRWAQTVLRAETLEAVFEPL